MDSIIRLKIFSDFFSKLYSISFKIDIWDNSHKIVIKSQFNSESGDSSVVTRWTADQEVVDSNPTHDRN